MLEGFYAGKRETKADKTNIREQEHEASKTTTSTTNVKTKGTVLLQTATATAVNDDGSRSIKYVYCSIRGVSARI